MIQPTCENISDCSRSQQSNKNSSPLRNRKRLTELKLNSQISKKEPMNGSIVLRKCFDKFQPKRMLVTSVLCYLMYRVTMDMFQPSSSEDNEDN